MIVEAVSVLASLMVAQQVAGLSVDSGCPQGRHKISISTGFRLQTATQPVNIKRGVFQLEECIRECGEDQRCLSFNFEAGMCVLLADSAAFNPGRLLRSNMPVFVMYGEKMCDPGLEDACSEDAPWIMETLPGFKINSPKFSFNASSKMKCFLHCIKDKEDCRSVSYSVKTGECYTSDKNRASAGARTELLVPDPQHSYLEPACSGGRADTCGMTEIPGRIYHTMDTVKHGVKSRSQCKELCKRSKYRCLSFDWNEVGIGVCRLSHHNTQTLRYEKQPYIQRAGSRTYEMSPCYNVTVVCTAETMKVQVQAETNFHGKIYTKNRPHSCMLDVESSRRFDLDVGYQDVRCNVQRDRSGGYTADVIIQHHDVVITNLDVGFHARCEYGMDNLHVKTAFQLPEDISDLTEDNLEPAALLSPPNITMRIADQEGHNINTAKIGDPLSLIFEIEDETSEYGMFIKDLVAMDGSDTNEILLIDSFGCPSNPGIMKSLKPMENTTSTSLITFFDAFKFPGSDTVQFQALVTLCMPTCASPVCPPANLNSGERIHSVARRSENSESNQAQNHQKTDLKKHETPEFDKVASNQTLVVAGVMMITDRFPFQEEEEVGDEGQGEHRLVGGAGGGGGGQSGVLVWIILICAQMVILILWLWAYKKHKKLNLEF